MNPERRSALLGETSGFSREVRELLVGRTKGFVQNAGGTFSEEDIVVELPFSKDGKKLSRFKAYVAEKKGQKVAGIATFNVLEQHMRS